MTNGDKDVLLEVKDLAVEYISAGEIIHAVNGVSFSLERGKTLALVGETGAGKTTIAKAILGILPVPPAKVQRGCILLNGFDLRKASELEMQRVRGNKVSMIFQDPMTALNPVMKIGNQISEVIKLHNNVSKSEARKQAVKMLEMVGITSERYDEYPHQFSGGMKQRVVIAMALACTPELLLADEPTTALDVTIQAQILEMIAQLRKERSTSIILITHDLGIVATNADTVAVMYGGEILEYGEKDEIFEHPLHPYTLGLFGAIPDLETDVRRLANIEGLPPNPADLPAGCCFSPRCPHIEEECKTRKFQLFHIGHGHYCRCGNSLVLGQEAQHA
ncbi:MAG: ABC transporter ATP-binding protein [Clostridiales bacterium]|jgi:peptide/nickel transport system ATP-binding protein|nr:ABC transporter ATP-binding protein [Clostridiales bacterium]